MNVGLFVLLLFGEEATDTGGDEGGDVGGIGENAGSVAVHLGF